MSQDSPRRSSVRLAPSVRQITLVLVIVLVGIAAFGFGTTRQPGPAEAAQVDATPVADAAPVVPVASPVASYALPCAEVSPGVGFEAWVRSELYFGAVSDEEWEGFLDNEVTPRFPDGLTYLEGYGQWRNSAGVITEEDSIVLIIFYPLEFAADASANLEEIRTEYKEQFDQESVLRVDDLPVCVSF
jgi:hypothetical protein